MYIEAMTPQKMSGCSATRKGPGVIPWIIRAAKIMALAAFPGIPRVRYDNIFVERLWRTVKYEEVYLHQYLTVSEAHRSLNK